MFAVRLLLGLVLLLLLLSLLLLQLLLQLLFPERVVLWCGECQARLAAGGVSRA